MNVCLHFPLLFHWCVMVFVANRSGKNHNPVITGFRTADASFTKPPWLGGVHSLSGHSVHRSRPSACLHRLPRLTASLCLGAPAPDVWPPVGLPTASCPIALVCPRGPISLGCPISLVSHSTAAQSVSVSVSLPGFSVSVGFFWTSFPLDRRSTATNSSSSSPHLHIPFFPLFFPPLYC